MTPRLRRYRDTTRIRRGFKSFELTDRAWADTFRKRGWSYQRLAEHFNCSIDTIRRVLRSVESNRERVAQ